MANEPTEAQPFLIAGGSPFYALQRKAKLIRAKCGTELFGPELLLMVAQQGRNSYLDAAAMGVGNAKPALISPVPS